MAPRDGLGAPNVRARRRLRTFALMVGCAWLGLSAAVASAQESPEQRAHLLYLAARNHFQRAEFPQAVDALQEAYKVFPQPLILVKLGEAYEKMGLWEKALDAYQHVGEFGDQEFKVRMENNIRTLEAAVERPVSVHITSRVPHLEVSIGESELTAPQTIMLKRGRHTLVAKREGYISLEKEIFVEGIGPMVVELEPEPLMGAVTIRSSGPAMGRHRIWIDDEPIAIEQTSAEEAALPERPLASGRHVLVCAEGEQVVTVPFYVTPGHTTEVVCEEGFVADSTAGGSDDETWAWVSATGAVAAVTAGALLLIDYENDKDLDARESGLEISSSSKPVAGGVLLGVGGALAITSTLLFLDVFEKDDSSGVEALGLAPLSEGGVAATIRGRW